MVVDLSYHLEAMDFEEKELKELSQKWDIQVLQKRKKADMLMEEFKKFRFQDIQENPQIKT